MSDFTTKLLHKNHQKRGLNHTVDFTHNAHIKGRYNNYQKLSKKRFDVATMSTFESRKSNETRLHSRNDELLD